MCNFVVTIIGRFYICGQCDDFVRVSYMYRIGISTHWLEKMGHHFVEAISKCFFLTENQRNFI